MKKIITLALLTVAVASFAAPVDKTDFAARSKELTPADKAAEYVALIEAQYPAVKASTVEGDKAWGYSIVYNAIHRQAKILKVFASVAEADKYAVEASEACGLDADKTAALRVHAHVLAAGSWPAGLAFAKTLTGDGRYFQRVKASALVHGGADAVEWESGYALAFSLGDFYLANTAARKLQSTEKTFAAVKGAIDSGKIRVNQYNLARNYVESLIAVSPDGSVTAADIKALLQTANRKFSGFLIQDKTNWEPVIAIIRTTLDTY